MADAKLPALTETSVLDVADCLYTVDVSDTTDDATGSSRKITLTRLGAFISHGICQGRLTLESGVPVSASDQTAKTNVYFTPCNGNRISVYDGTRWKYYSFSEITLALGTLTSGKNYDVFIYDNSGTLTLEFSAAWTNDTTRADALALQDGIYVKSGSTTRRHLGSIRTTATTTTEDSKAKRFVSNRYNRAVRGLANAAETTNSWAYNSTTIRQANANTANQLDYLDCVGDAMVDATVGAIGYTSGGAIGAMIGIGVDSTTANSAQSIGTVEYNASYTSFSASRYAGVPGLGRHYLPWLEATAGGVTFDGDNGGYASLLWQSGMTGSVMT
jgi:hypothetical protein